MLRIIVLISFAAAAVIWGDWKNIRKYYSSIQYFIICSLLYLALYAHYPLWRFEPAPPLDGILFNDTLITLVLTFTVFPCTVLVFLSRYPKGVKQVWYMLFWIVLYSVIELIMSMRGKITYHNGWNLGWSIFFNVCMFTLLRLHSIKPFMALGGSVVFIIFILAVFGFPIK